MFTGDYEKCDLTTKSGVGSFPAVLRRGNLNESDLQVITLDSLEAWGTAELDRVEQRYRGFITHNSRYGTAGRRRANG